MYKEQFSQAVNTFLVKSKKFRFHRLMKTRYSAVLLYRSHVVQVYLRVSFEVSLVKRLEVALVRAWVNGLASWCDRVGEVGGAE